MPESASMTEMKSTAEMRLAIIEQMAEALLDLNDPGDWSESEVEEARDAAQEYATTLLDMFAVDIEVTGEESFTLAGKLADVRKFMDSYLTEPLVKGEFD